ncbi:sigma factor-like helix-turn-helix DNA-binding protein [Streptomyces sp. NPDC049597]|uniref:sigma factor-like helix-turn-helix DNA-binding protein n=1 Tax=Streptomyces sp. NPDC049597 TaxID=3155276 RepID=UPI00342D82C5
MTQSATHSASGASPLPPPRERRRLREAKSLTETQFATMLGVTRATIRSWETGRASPRGRKREAYAKLLAAFETEGAAASEERAAHETAPRREAPEPATEAVHETSAPYEADHEASAAPEPDSGTPAAPEPDHETPTAPEPDHETPTAPEPDHETPTAPEPDHETPTAPEPDLEAPAAPHPEPQTGHVTKTDPAAETDPVIETAERLDGPERQSPVRDDPAADAGPASVEPPLPVPLAGMTPVEAFDALYTYAAPELLRQTYVLTGRRCLSQKSVERAFHLAWQHWPEVAVDRDPTGWVRAAAYDCALSPWQRLRPAHRHPDEPLDDPAGRTLMQALQELPPTQRRAFLLHDGVGLGLPETAAETEASTPATVNRVLRAREVVAERLPRLADADVLQDELRALLAAAPTPRPASAGAVRTGCEHRAEMWTRAVVVATALIVVATAVALLTSPRQYEPPVPPSRQVEGVPPPHGGPQLLNGAPFSGPRRLSAKDRQLRDKLRAEPAAGPERLLPQLR